MNCSEVTYGRKIIKNNRKSEFQKILYLSWCVCFLVGVLVGAIVGALGFWGITAANAKTHNVEYHEPNVPMNEETSSNEVIEEPAVEEVVEEVVEVKDEFVPLDVPMNEDLQEFIYQLSDEYDVDFALVMALIEHESSFRTNVRSDTNDYGLMQINSINHEWLTETLGVTDFLDPYQNAKSGIFMLTDLFKKYEDPAKVLMAYNMGETGARRLWAKGIYETDYSSSIMKQAAEYEQQISEMKGDSNVLH